MSTPECTVGLGRGPLEDLGLLGVGLGLGDRALGDLSATSASMTVCTFWALATAATVWPEANAVLSSASVIPIALATTEVSVALLRNSRKRLVSDAPRRP